MVRTLSRPNNWWPLRSGHEASQVDLQAWLTSLVVHLAILLVCALASFYLPHAPVELTFRSEVVTVVDEPEIVKDFQFSPEPTFEVGADQLQGTQLALGLAPAVSEISHVVSPPTPLFEVGELELLDSAELATAPEVDLTQMVRGDSGVSLAGAEGAIDRITHEILLSLEERPTLVVWLFDQSRSLAPRRDQIRKRFERIYEELGLATQSGDAAVHSVESEPPLLTVIGAFGQKTALLTPRPTAELDQIKAAVESIPVDDSGVERVFSAIYQSADKYKAFRRYHPDRKGPKRNVMFVVVTDEVGDDPQGIDHTVDLCRRLAMPVFVIGVPAPFGRSESLVKWVDPDPRYDQRPRWGRVNQGPESLFPERLRLHFSGSRENLASIDSGFGSYGLTRLCHETGGIFFAIHPDRHTDKKVRRQATSAYAAHFEHFFDPQTMRRYRPTYVSAREYQRILDDRPMRRALVRASRMSWLEPLENPRLRFVKRSDAELATALTEAQKSAAKLEPKVNAIFTVLKQGEGDREREESPRWQAGYDLAMGRILAIKVRTESYNAMLARAKRGMRFDKQENNTWNLETSNDGSLGTQLDRIAKSALTYLERTMSDHPGTPWALLAKRELATPMGWKWTESYTELSPPRNRQGAGNPRPRLPTDDQRKMLPKKKPSRPIPKL